MKKYTLFFFILFSHFWLDFFAGIWPLYKSMLGISLVQAGLIATIATGVGNFSQGLFGFFGDRGRRKFLLVLGLLAGGSISLITLGNHWAFLFLALLMTTLGSGAFHPSAAGSLTILFPKRKGILLIFTCFGMLGLGLSQLIFSTVLKASGGSALPLLLPIALIGLCILFLRVPETDQPRHPFSVQEFLATFRSKKYALLRLYITLVLGYGVIFGFVFLLPEILKAKGGGGWIAHGGGHMLIIFSGLLGMLITSVTGPRMGWKPSIFAFSLIGGLSLAFFLLTPLAIGAFFLSAIGFFIVPIGPMILAWGNQLVPESPSTVSGLLMGMAWGVSDLFPLGSSLLTGLFTTNAPISAMLCLTPLFAVCAMLTLQVRPLDVPASSQ